MKLQHILVPTDLSPDSDRPFAFVAQLAKDTEAKVTLLAVIENIPYIPYGAPLAPPLASADLEARRREALDRLEDLRNELPQSIDVAVAAVDSSDVAHAISEYASEEGADLVAISTHGRTGWRRAILGSVAERVLRESEVPVLSFHRGKAPEKA
ncbi:MAG: universal stress protein [Planctomycetota bacterium]